MNIQMLMYETDVPVSFLDNGYLNATTIANHFGKKVKDYLKTEQTQQYIAALTESLSKGRKILLEQNQLVIVKHGGVGNGTWLHPKLAIPFARWLDPKFAVWCDGQIEQILSGSLKPNADSPYGQWLFYGRAFAVLAKLDAFTRLYCQHSEQAS